MSGDILDDDPKAVDSESSTSSGDEEYQQQDMGYDLTDVPKGSYNQGKPPNEWKNIINIMREEFVNNEPVRHQVTH